MAYRRSYNDLAYDEQDPGPRWDRDRFERVRARSRGPGPRISSDSFRFDERDRYGPSGDSRELEISDRVDRFSPRGSRFDKRDRFFEEERYGPPARRSRPEFFEEDRYEERERVRPRPGYARRQSSWDAHDRRPIPRYEDRPGDDEDVKVSIKVNQRSPSPPFRREERPAVREKIVYRDPEPHYPEEDYRGSRIVAERERYIDRRGPREPEIRREEPPLSPVRDKKLGRRGKTRMPKRLVHKRAVIDLGYPFIEEDDFFVVTLALEKEQIDEVIKISETYKEERTTYKYDDFKQLEAPPPPPVANLTEENLSKVGSIKDEGQAEVIETVTTKVIENPTPSEYEKYTGGERAKSEHGSKVERFSEHESVHRETAHGSETEKGDVYIRKRSQSRRRSGRGRSKSRVRERRVSDEEFEERVEESSGAIGGPLTLVLPRRSKSRAKSRSAREVNDEIRVVEDERRRVRERDDPQYEFVRPHHHHHKRKDDEFERVEREEKSEREVVRVEKDRRGKSRARSKSRRGERARSKSRRGEREVVSNPAIAAALRTLT